MVVKKTIIEESPESDDAVVQKTKTIVDPDIHTEVVHENSEVVDSPTGTVTKKTKTVQEPLVKADHPQKVYESKKVIFRSWQIIWFFLIVIEVFLALRMMLKAIGANPFSGFVSFIYGVSDILTLPFSGIVPSSVSGNTIIEWSTIIASIVYALIAWGLVAVIHMMRPVTPEEVEHNV